MLITSRDEQRGADTAADIEDIGAAGGVGGVGVVLIDNAGAVIPSRRESEDGHELMLATNFLGPFAFTNLLADRVRMRIVVVGSDAHRSARVDLEDPHFRARRWSIGAA